MTTNKTPTIRDLNDRFRKGDPAITGETYMTCGIADLLGNDPANYLALSKLIQDYDSFDQDNDPYGEHDFGAFTFLGQKCFWRVDIYDPTLKWAASDPTNPKTSRRVLTIMLAQEY